MNYSFSENHDVNKMLNQVVESITSLANSQVMHIRRLTKIGNHSPQRQICIRSGI
mgnify:CR=1 FL=1